MNVEKRQSLEGELRNIVFSNESGSFVVARLNAEDGSMKTIVGNLAGVKAGEFLRLQGEWVENAKFGKQFQVATYLVQSPKTLVGLERYLSSGVLPGIGPKTAERIVQEFGTSTLEILEKQPEKLRKISGIGANRIEKIIAAWQTRRSLSEVMVFLQSNGISPAFAERIYRLYRENSVAMIKNNPYRLAWEIHGIGFKKADLIAKEIGVAADSPQRAEAGILYILRSFSDQGHVFYPLDAILSEAALMLEVSEDVIGSGIQLALREGRVVLEEATFENAVGEDGFTTETWRGQILYLEKMHQAELGTVQEMLRLHRGEKPTTLKIDAAAETDVELGAEQKLALTTVLGSRLSIITGGPGTGKTTMIRTLVRLLKAAGEQVLLTAPTGRAAKRLSEATGEEAKTIHRLLEYRPRERKFARNHDNPLPCDWLIVDETSMVDIFLMQQLLEGVGDNARIVLVGDVDQLPSVGCGNVLKDLIDSQVIAVSVLRQIYRQARGSLISINAHSINRGDFPQLVPFPGLESEFTSATEEIGPSDFYFIREDDPVRMAERIRWLCASQLKEKFAIDPLQDVQVITPMHKGDVGSINLNQTIQEAINPKRAGTLEIKRGERTFRILDRVMQMRNNYDREVFNGDIGQIIGIDLEEGEVLIRFDHTEATYTVGELDEVELAYAVTVHKSQGSEYPVVILPVTTQHFIMLQRNLIYTAITRGKELVIIIGSTKALAMAIKNNRMTKRYTLLAQRLRKVLA